MQTYTFSENSTLGSTVARLMQQPHQHHLALFEELALARASIGPIITAFDNADDDIQRAVWSDKLRDALLDVSALAERAAKIQSQTLITPATIALLATQIEQIAGETLSGLPLVHSEFVSRIQAAMTGITLVSTSSEDSVLRPSETAALMDATVPEFDDSDASSITEVVDSDAVPSEAESALADAGEVH